jgi:thiol:disulfide interchange protein DsbD
MSEKIFRFTIFAFALIVPARAALPQQIQAKHARVELLSRQSAVAPGADVSLGLHFILEKGWHIYWVNPGDSGQPPSLKWQLPAGLTAGDIQWPRPERMQSSPTLADYGYHNDVLLAVPVQVATTPGAGAKADIAVDANWLICREVCIPDKAQLKLTLPVASAPSVNPQAASLFAATEKLLPRPWPVKWKASADSRNEDFVLVIETGRSISKAEFFPLDPDQIDNAARQRLQPTAKGVKLVLKKSDLLLKPISVMRGVLVLPGLGAYQVKAPVVAQVAVK